VEQGDSGRGAVARRSPAIAVRGFGAAPPRGGAKAATAVRVAALAAAPHPAAKAAPARKGRR
jgi:hypothetical protein